MATKLIEFINGNTDESKKVKEGSKKFKELSEDPEWKRVITEEEAASFDKAPEADAAAEEPAAPEAEEPAVEEVASETAPVVEEQHVVEDKGYPYFG